MNQPLHLQTTTGMSATLGRFELQRLLGRGAQAGVWLAHDPRLQRDVALKVLHTPGGGHQPQLADQWLQEARSLSRLVHPHIVTLYEADMFDGRPGLVLEMVNGQSLSQKLATEGPLPASEAVRLMVQVLDALQHAHSSGVIHRDLKPANILLDTEGNAKVSDFGIAMQLRQTGAGTLASGTHVEGTPNYLSPEAARGEPPTPQHDVFAAGLLLAEMLTGRPLVAEKEAFRAIYRMAHEDLVMPSDPAHPVDDALRALVQRALARDTSLRWTSAADMANALREWASAAQRDGQNATDTGNSATLEFLLRRMRRTTDFPAMSAQIVKVQSLASSDSESLNSLTSEILKDVALTNKLLRIVNSAHFSHVGGGHINTVSRAVSLIGFAGIRNVAMSLVLLDHMENKAHAAQLKGEFLRALLAGALAADMGPGTREGEEVFIGALLQNLGRMLTEFYLPDEAAQIRQTMAVPASLRGAPAPTEEQASQAVLGITYEALGQGVGKTWGLPDSMLKLMRKPAGAPPSVRPSDPQARLHWVTVAANELADTFLHAADKDQATQLRKVATQYAVCLGQSSDSIEKAAHTAREKLTETAAAIGLTVPAHSPAAKLLRPASATPGARANPADTTGLHELQATTRAFDRTAVASAKPTDPLDAPEESDASRQARADQASAMLATGIQDITNAMVDTFKLNDVLRMILETMYRAMGFRQVLFCLKDGQSGVLLGRFGLGDNASESARHFKVVLNEPNNLLAMVCNKGVDTLIHDASASKVHQSLPGWFHQHIHAQSFMLLPLQLRGTPLGLIYADQATADSIALDDKGLSLLKTLRNQAVMAFRQSMPMR